MARITIIGGGLGGLSSALLLARDGHHVTVLERDPAEPPPPEQAWAAWERRSVNQFRLPHYLLARFRHLLDSELPDVAAALIGAGALRFNQLDAVPAAFTGGHRPGDDRFTQITGRRPVVEAVIAAIAAVEPGVQVRRGVTVGGLRADNVRHGEVPAVVGVVLADGEVISSDLVVDAGGRRSNLPIWLADIGARPPVEDVADCGFAYYGRHFRSDDGSTPTLLSAPNQPYDSVSILTLPADNGTWSVTLTASAKDAAMRRVKDVEVWTRVVGSYPLAAHWLDGEPLTGVDVMAKLEDRVRHFVVDGHPVATGVVAVGDAWACTNPSVGRGASLALLHATCLRDLLRDVDVAHRDEVARRWWEVTAEVVEPWVSDTAAFDRHRLAQIDADIAGHPYEPADPSWRIGETLRRTIWSDPELLRGYVDVSMVLERATDVVARPGFMDRLFTAAPAPDPPSPSRSELVELLGTRTPVGLPVPIG